MITKTKQIVAIRDFVCTD